MFSPESRDHGRRYSILPAPSIRALATMGFPEAAKVDYRFGGVSDQLSTAWRQLGMAVKLSGKRVAVLGAGKMGGILVKALLEKKLLSPSLTAATVQHEERATTLSQKLR